MEPRRSYTYALGYEYDGFERSIDSYVKNIRKKLTTPSMRTATYARCTAWLQDLGVRRDEYQAVPEDEADFQYMVIVIVCMLVIPTASLSC